MKLICLCNGKGERLAPLTENIPKPLIPINGVPNILNTCNIICHTMNIDQILIAAGDGYFNHPMHKKFMEEFDDYNGRIEVLEVNCDKVVGNNCMTLLQVLDTESFFRPSYYEHGHIVVEGDIYISENFEEVLKNHLYSAAQTISKVFCTYRKNEWVVLNSERGIPRVVKGANGLSLSGVSYVAPGDITSLHESLRDNRDHDRFWDELFIDKCYDLDVVDSGEGTLKEFDYVSDLISQKLMTSKEVAQIVNDDTAQIDTPESMTNENFKVYRKGVPYILRVPKDGTDNFISRERESYVLSLIKDRGLTPESHIYPGGVKLSKYVDCRTSNETDIIKVFDILGNLHNTRNDIFNNINSESLIKDLLVDLIEELDSYKKMYRPDILKRAEIPVMTYYNVSCKYREYIKHWQHHNLSLCHRDLDLRNILITSPQEVPQLIDFEYSGLLNANWDLGCYLSELRLNGKLNKDAIEDFEKGLRRYAYQTGRVGGVSMQAVEVWSGVVDYVWSCWSLAQCSRGENYYDYLRKRWKSACLICENLISTT